MLGLRRSMRRGIAYELICSTTKKVLKMQKINRNELAKSAVAGGCCKCANKTTPVAATPVVKA
jgi:hypothetical protein